MKKLIFYGLISLCLINVVQAGFFQKKAVQNPAASTPESRARDERNRKLFLQSELVRESGQLEEGFYLNKAIEISKKAVGDEYVTEERDKGRPLMNVLLLETYLGNYDSALVASKEYIRVSPGNDWGLEQKKKIEALVTWNNTGNKQPIYNWIESTKKKNAQWLPPTDPKETVWQRPVMIGFVELYELLGDYDLAISEIRPFSEFYKTLSHSEWLVKELEEIIFELEAMKRGEPKICIEDGKVCLGRATAYIIKSKSF